MELINKDDMAVWTPFATNTENKVFVASLRQVQDKLGAYISDELVTAIMALTRDSGTSAEIYQFWLNYVRPFVVYSVFVKLCESHGFNMSPQGITVFRDGQNTAQAISAQERSALIRKYTTERETWLTKMIQQFNAADGTFDGTLYEIDDDIYDEQVRKVPALNVLGGVNKRLPYNQKFRL